LNHRIIICLFFALVLAPGRGVPDDLSACGPDRCYTETEAREDLQQMYEQLRDNHFDLFARRSAADYDRLLANLLNEIDGPVEKHRFHLALQRLAAFGEIGHAKTEAAILDALGHLRAGGEIIPLSIRYEDETMRLDAWADEADAMPPGSELSSLGGMDLAAFEARARTLVSADTDRLLRAQLEMGLPLFLYLVFGDVDGLEVGYTGPDGVAGTHHVPARTWEATQSLALARPVGRPDFAPDSRAYEDLGDGVFYLRPGPFLATEAEREAGADVYDASAFRDFIEAAFAGLEDSGADDLLIDLRGNIGGDVSFSDLLVARIADRPFTFASRYRVRAGALTRSAWAGKSGDAGSISGRVSRGLAQAQPGEVFDVPVPESRPAATGRFQGRVWVLINRHSYSNAAVVAAQIQDHGFGTLLGQATADLATTYGAVERFTLSNSGAEIVYPKAYMVRPSGSEAVSGVQPDVVLPLQPIGETTDRVLEAALAHIRAGGDSPG
jgi:hypothetical protein